MIRIFLLIVGGGVLLAAPKTAQPLQGRNAASSSPANAVAKGPGPATTKESLANDPSTSWWLRFQDPQLNDLIERALRQSPQMHLAASRVLEARQMRRVAGSRLLPSADASLAAQRLRGGFNQGVLRVDPTVPAGSQSSRPSLLSPFETGLFSGTAGLAWEADLFGRLRGQTKAADAGLAQQQELAEQVKLLLTAEVASAYLGLRGAGHRLAVLQQQVATQEDALQLVNARAEAGLAAPFDTVRQRALVDSTRAAIAPLQAERQRHLHHLAALLGAQPSQMEQELAALAPGVAVAPELPASLPSDLLLRRPDVRAANQAIAQALEQVGVARADLFPRISFTGQFGRQGTSLPTLSLGGGNFFGLGPSVTLPIFTAGRLKANLAAEQERWQQAKHQFEQQVLVAFEEAETALSDWRWEAERRRQLAATRAHRATAVDLAKDQFRAGLQDYLVVLDAQRELLSAEQDLAAAEVAEGLRAVALCRAFGGGW